MREIKFRGKSVGGRWIYGYPADYNYINNINEVAMPCEEVDPSTIGQFAGIRDKFGNEIYEGDILQWSENGCKSNPMEVVVKYGAFGYLYYGFHSLVGNTNFTFYLKGTDSRFEIIGNIHDNPELVEIVNGREKGGVQ